MHENVARAWVGTGWTGGGEMGTGNQKQETENRPSYISNAKQLQAYTNIHKDHTHAYKCKCASTISAERCINCFKAKQEDDKEEERNEK